MAEPSPENPAEAPTVDEATTGVAVPAAGSVDEGPASTPAEAAHQVSPDDDAHAGADLPAGGIAVPDIDLSHLPVHTRSLLKIEVAVTVTLARQRRPIHEITELGPGTLVKFEKTYDEPLELTVGDLPIARGEVVKVGDKFGLRIGKLIRPHERFASVR